MQTPNKKQREGGETDYRLLVQKPKASFLPLYHALRIPSQIETKLEPELTLDQARLTAVSKRRLK